MSVYVGEEEEKIAKRTERAIKQKGCKFPGHKTAGKKANQKAKTKNPLFIKKKV